MNDILEHHGVKGQKWGQVHLKEGTKLNRVSDVDETLGSGRTFASHTKNDKKTYEDGMTNYNAITDAKTYSMTLKASKRILTPTKKKTIELFMNEYRKDPVAVSKAAANGHVSDHLITLGRKHWERKYSKINSKNAEKAYTDFNASLGVKDYKNKSVDSFLNSVRDSNYNALVDVHDVVSKRGAHTESPLIVLDANKNLKKVASKDITKTFDQIMSEANS